MSITDHRRRLAGANARLSESGWTWSARTSDENVDPPTFGTATAVASILPTDNRVGRDDFDTGGFEVERMNVRMSTYGVTPLPEVGDMFTDPSANDWSIEDIESQQWGMTVYVIERMERKTMGRPRGRWAT